MQEIYSVDELIKFTYLNIDSLQDRIHDLNCQKHKEVKNINDIKALSEAQKNYVAILESLERIKCLKIEIEVANGTM